MAFSGIIGILLGGINIFMIGSALRGSSLPMLQNEKTVFITAFVICLAMCSIGITNMLGNRDFRVTGFIIGGVIGAALLIMFFSVISNSQVPVLKTVHNSLIALLVLMSVKLAVSTANIVFLSVTGGAR